MEGFGSSVNIEPAGSNPTVHRCTVIPQRRLDVFFLTQLTIYLLPTEIESGGPGIDGQRDESHRDILRIMGTAVTVSIPSNR